MSNFLDACDQHFGTRNFYDVLQIKRNASFTEIKKAYYKVSLLVHPDRVAEDKKIEATEKFKVLGKIHSILANQTKRDNYDESGEFDEEQVTIFNWSDYWHSLFKQITFNDIKKYEQEYIGSVTEKNDVKRAYLDSKGNMDHITETVPFVNCDSEPRLIEMVKGMIEREEVPEFKSFTEEPQQKKDLRKKNWEKEKAEAGVMSEDEVNKELQENQARRDKKMVDLLSNLEAKYKGKYVNRREIIRKASLQRRKRFKE